MQTVTSTDGTRIAVERHGEGEGVPVVLLHGGSAPDYWRPVLPHFGDDHPLLVPHRRGVGASEDSETYSLARGVADVRAVVDSLDEPPVLFGHSFGGLLAVEAARDAVLAGLVAYEPAVLVGDDRERADLAARMRARLDAGDREGAMREYLCEVLHGGEHPDLDAWLDAWPAWPDVLDLAENVARITRAIEGYRLPDRLAVAAPTLLLTGTESPSHLRGGVRAVHGAVPESRLVEFDDLGHGGPSAVPDRVVPTVREFLDAEARLSPRTRRP